MKSCVRGRGRFGEPLLTRIPDPIADIKKRYLEELRIVIRWD
jgi:hypothetical protein